MLKEFPKTYRKKFTMNNIIILGTGRSGTSMTAGLFSGGDYFMGDRINKPNETNPKGQFEDYHINQLNENLIDKVVNSRPEGWIGDTFFSCRPRKDQKWLSILKKPVDFVKLNDQQIHKIQYYASKSPFCYKDPRFSYSLPIWLPYLTNTKYIIVFRHPSLTINSMLVQKQRVTHLSDFKFDRSYLYKVYESMYSHILNVILPSLNTCDYLIVNYDQLFENQNLDKIAAFSEYEIDRSFPDPAIKKSIGVTNMDLSKKIIMIYNKLCTLSNYTKN